MEPMNHSKYRWLRVRPRRQYRGRQLTENAVVGKRYGCGCGGSQSSLSAALATPRRSARGHVPWTMSAAAARRAPDVQRHLSTAAAGSHQYGPTIGNLRGAAQLNGRPVLRPRPPHSQPHLVQADWIKPGAAVLDVGVTRVGAAESGRAKLAGDVPPTWPRCRGRGMALTQPGRSGPGDPCSAGRHVVESAERAALRLGAAPIAQ
jgi:hypothetical protein